MSAEVYEIRVKGHLDGDYWAEWFDGMAVALDEEGTTTLTGPVADQAALHGLLVKVRDLGLALISVNRIEPTQSSGASTALVVYSAGLGGFLAKVSHAFAEGLVANGWRVELTTASDETPTDLSNYGLLVLGAHTYFWTPDRIIRRYLGRLGNLAGRRVAVIVTAFGQGERSAATLSRLVQEANGDLIRTLILYTLRPNEDLYGTNDVEKIARQEAAAIGEN